MIDDSSLLTSASKDSRFFGASRAVQTVFRASSNKFFRLRHTDHPDIVHRGQQPTLDRHAIYPYSWSPAGVNPETSSSLSRIGCRPA